MDHRKFINRILEEEMRRLKEQYRESEEEQSDDPFEVYQYEGPRLNEEILSQLQANAKSCIRKQMNRQKHRELSERMKEEEYILDKIIQTQQIQLSSIEMVIERLDQTLQSALQTVAPSHPKFTIGKSCQTTSISMEDDSFQCEFKEKTEKKAKVCVKVPVYSLQVDMEKKSEKGKGVEEGNDRMDLKSLYSEIEREYAYLEEVKQNRKKYREQKKKVSFLMDLFWKLKK